MDKPVQGFALYIEIAEPNKTQQVLFIPTGYDSSGRLVKERYFYREISSGYSKALWRLVVVPEINPEIEGTRQAVYEKFGVIMTWLGISRDEHDYSLVGKPLFVEVSRLDYDDIINSKTPTKLIYRVNQSRIGAGYPVEVA